VERDAILGSPRWITRPGELLAKPDAGAAKVGLAEVAASEPDPDRRVVKQYLARNFAWIGHGPELLDQTRSRREDRPSTGRIRSIVLQQQLDGLDVFESQLVANLTDGGALISLATTLHPRLEPAADQGTPDRRAKVLTPPITAAEALVRAAANVGETLTQPGVRPLKLEPGNRSDFQEYHADKLKDRAHLRLVWLPMSRSVVRLAWEVLLTPVSRGELYRVLVDAQDGKVVVRHCLTYYASDATFRVFTSDSPSPLSPGHRVPSSVQPPLVSRQLVTLTALSTNASPAGWIGDGVNELRGNNVDAHLDRDDDDRPDLPRTQGSPFRVFDFSLNLGQSPATYGDAAATQLFYWNNWIHDRLYDLGFTESVGNFQDSNFGRGGLGNDAVQADAQDGGRFNNANFTAPPDGLPGRMQMYLFNGPTPDRDGSFDAEVVLHEYVHGLTSRLVGGGAGITQLQTAGMGEGWSDFYALTLLSEAQDALDAPYAAGAYASYLLDGLTENYYFGIRRYPYCTDLSMC
jgi:hypothetical protein